jgi:hypothetical protein
MKSEVLCWEFNTTSVSLGEVFEWAIAAYGVDRLLFGIRMCFTPGKSRQRSPCSPAQVASIHKHFRNVLIAAYSVEGWPGTEFGPRPVPAVKLELNPRVIEKCVQLGPHLDNWSRHGKPALPEDPCIFREGAELPAIVSVSHEKIAWALADESRRPKFGALVTQPLPRDLVFEGTSFCKNPRECRLTFMKQIRDCVQENRNVKHSKTPP